MVVYTPAPYEQKTIAVLALANKSFDEIVQTLPNEWSDDGRTAAFCALQSIGVEHLRAILMLCESGEAIGSAMALFRPMADAIVRAEWLYLCASVSILTKFWKNESHFPGDNYKFEKLAAAVDQKLGGTNRLSLYGKYYTNMRDWTHSGYASVASRISKTTGDIEPSYSDHHIRQLLGSAIAFVQMHVRQMAEVFNFSVELSETAPWTDDEIPD